MYSRVSLLKSIQQVILPMAKALFVFKTEDFHQYFNLLTDKTLAFIIGCDDGKTILDVLMPNHFILGMAF